MGLVRDIRGYGDGVVRRYSVAIVVEEMHVLNYFVFNNEQRHYDAIVNKEEPSLIIYGMQLNCGTGKIGGLRIDYSVCITNGVVAISRCSCVVIRVRREVYSF